ncbi:response regulator transcription factor [Sphingomonas sp. C3-2]|uniref:response regulator transcription factor n=1 Tax=Sphingomonas sp. C3-2 TaxID=3062169 RepID=UPI00294AACF5|nr:response regulator transcription factor [Sphingomonas sp. C3-2]WOK37239.1 response regulator transcription factor [Sphingomonas sp. C3-2]
MNTRVLIVEDDPALQHVLEATLEFGGFVSTTAQTGREALALFEGGGFDAVLLDMGLPDQDGEALLSRMRAHSPVPILVVSGFDSEKDRIAALDRGADDFVPKPFLPGELLARIRAALRRTGAPVAPGPEGSSEMIDLDPEKPCAIVGGELVYFSANEHRLLTILAKGGDRAVEADEILNALWDKADAAAQRHLRVLIHKVREKIETDPKTPKYLLTVHGMGYRLRAVLKPVAKAA